MYRPSCFAFTSGYYYYYADGSRFHFARLVPVGPSEVVKAKVSWLTQGKHVNNGNEVAHCKLVGGIGKRQPLLPVSDITRGSSSDYKCMSGVYYSQGGARNGCTVYRFFIDDKISIEAYATASTSSVYVDVQIFFNGIKYSNTSARYKCIYARVTIDRLGHVNIKRTNVPSSLRSEFMNVTAGYMYSVLDLEFKRRDPSYTQSLVDACMPFFSTLYERYAPTSMNSAALVTDFTWIQPEQSFALDEPWTILGGAPISVPFAAYHLAALRQEAYVGCLDSVPSMSDNNISNILEIVGLIKGLVVDHKIEVPRNIADAWMSYRYVYKTTEMDVKDTLSYIRRSARDLSKGFSCHGSATGKITEDITATVRCCMHFKHRELDTLSTLCEKLDVYGLKPNSYIVWDMIPYSFIVDWFIPVGNILQQHDKDQKYNRNYDISNIWYSLSYDHQVDGGYVMHCYTRWSERDTPGINGFYTIESMDASNKVKGMRILDTLALTYKR